MKLHHVGYLVENIDTSYNDIAKTMSVAEKSQTFYDSEQDAFIKFIWQDNSIEQSCIELVQPGKNNEALKKLLKKNGDYLYHICYETSSLDTKVEEFVKNGAIIIKHKKKAIAFNNKEVVFLFIRRGLIIELVQK